MKHTHILLLLLTLVSCTDNQQPVSDNLALPSSIATRPSSSKIGRPSLLRPFNLTVETP